MTRRLEGKVALVTGASRGLGYATAMNLAREGAHVIATARTKGGLEELDDEIKLTGGSATLVPMDIRDFDAIDRLGGVIFERWKRLDVLIGNAGIFGKMTPLAHVEPAKFMEVLEITVTANFRLIRSMDPLLRMSEAGRAIFITSGATYKCAPYYGTYAPQRAALEAMVKIYAREMATTNVRANCFSPGPTRTAMRAFAIPGEDPMTLPTPEDVAPQIIPMCLPEFTDFASVYKYAATGLYRQYGGDDLVPKG
jgi:NAD(P)-dependent dehydrogenase (short-subunit alcohol dehydrogenase family)